MLREKHFQDLVRRLAISEGAEYARARAVWRALVKPFHGRSARLGLTGLGLIEEAVVWGVIAGRHLAILGQDGLYPNAKSGAPHPAIEAYAKANERHRKAMNELRETSGDSGAEPRGLLEIAEYILKKGEGVLEECIEAEAERDAAESAPAHVYEAEDDVSIEAPNAPLEWSRSAEPIESPEPPKPADTIEPQEPPVEPLQHAAPQPAEPQTSRPAYSARASGIRRITGQNESARRQWLDSAPVFPQNAGYWRPPSCNNSTASYVPLE